MEVYVGYNFKDNSHQDANRRVAGVNEIVDQFFEGKELIKDLYNIKRIN